ncbi:MAG: sulfotransferase [Spirochaetales bacterium]|nr:sulfotransferase [Spirochaetales bacterium]
MTCSQKHCVFLSSTGRTGTKFFGETMSRMIGDCVSVHEPDTTRVSNWADWISKMARFGVPKMLWGQYRQCYSLGKLTTTRQRNLCGDEKAKGYIIDNRREYINSFRKGLYIESNHIIYGLLDLIAEVFPNSKIIWIMRDPRTWIRSAINATAFHLYGPFDWNSLNLSVRAYNFPGDASAGRWNAMSKFEKYCWYYNSVNSRAFELMERVPNFRVYRYEDLFNNEIRDEYFLDMLRYATTFEDGFSRDFSYRPELLDIKIHAAASKRMVPKWEEWGSPLVEMMDRHCGAFMKEFGYGNEALWKKKLKLSGASA